MNVIDYMTITCNLKNVQLQITSDYMKKCNRLQIMITPCLHTSTLRTKKILNDTSYRHNVEIDLQHPCHVEPNIRFTLHFEHLLKLSRQGHRRGTRLVIPHSPTFLEMKKIVTWKLKKYCPRIIEYALKLPLVAWKFDASLPSPPFSTPSPSASSSHTLSTAMPR